MMGFETLTLAPIDRRLIVKELLAPDEIAWLDAYHARVLETIGPELDAETRGWLTRAAAPL
jgi:Xaa-Pro aminopeptidase